MSQVLDKVREVDPNNSEAIKDVVNSFFQNLSKTDGPITIKWLRTLVDVINRFPKYCMTHRSIIETLISEAIDSNNNFYVIEAAKCAQALQQVRPSQEKTATPKTSWRDQMNLLCDAAHSLISAVFPNAVDMYKGAKNAKDQHHGSSSSLTAALLNIKSVSNIKNKSEKQMLLQTRLKNIFCFIQAMLVEIYPVAKPIRPQIILDVVVRALSVSSGNKTTGVDVAVIKIEALRTIDALVACLGPNLIPFSPLVFRLLMQTLRWTSDNADKDFSIVRCTAYNSISKWLNTLHSHRSAADSRSSWEDELTNHIINDIAQHEKIVELTIGPQPTKHLSKKAKRKLANAKLLESSIASHMPGERNKVAVPEEVNNAIAMAALDCAETFLLVCGRFLKPATHKVFQERTIRACLSAGNPAKCGEHQLLSFLRVLEAARKSAPPTAAPPTQYCLHLYSTLINCPYLNVSKFCTQALLDIRLHLHCSPPSLNYELDAPQEKPTTNKRKKISEKNMTALKSLLGISSQQVQRMSSLASEEHVVTIPDEPITKKARIDKEDDKISVSSDSISSVEISDDSDVQEVDPDDNDSEIEEESNKKVEETIEKEHVIEVEVTNKTVEPELETCTKESAIENVIVENGTAQLVEGGDIEKPIDVVDSNSMTATPEQSVTDTASDKNIKNVTIHEAPTQMPLNTSTDTTEGEDGPLSMEIAYDYPKSGTVKLNADNDALPCTNETDDDDIVITCGQTVKSSQETNPEKASDDTDVSMGVVIAPKVNGNVSENEIVENGVNIPVDNAENADDSIKNVQNENIKDDGNDASKTMSKGEVSIEEMMADFVDEVNEDVAV